MAKPLISDAAMRGMYRTMQHLRAVKRDPNLTAALSRPERARIQTAPESLYAALFSQVHRRDALLIEGSGQLMHAAADLSVPGNAAKPAIHAVPGTSQECAAYAAGMALQHASSIKRAPPRSIVCAVLHEFSAMPGVLQLIEQYDLSVLLIAQGEPESRVDAQRRLLSTTVPIMPVDAADAVAVCRVVQECMLRARNGWGGAVIHALRLPDAGDPLALLEAHLRKRNLLPEIA